MSTRIIIEGLGDVAPIAVWQQTFLETAVGGEASAGVIAIRDVGIDRREFIPMARTTIDSGVGTDPYYSGYLIKPSRRFFFSVDKPDTLQRLWVLHMADINLLWSRRVVYNQSDPANIEGPKYTTDTWDDDALAELFADWVDLSFDDLDLTSRVSRVGLINYDQTVYPWNGGETLGEAVNTIAQLPAAVYGIDSLRRVVYADVDDENAPFVFTDAYIPLVTHPSPVFSTNKNATTPLYDPQLGTTVIGLLLDLDIDPGDPTEISDWIGEDARVSWLKMVLNTEANLRFDTFGSYVNDTIIFIYKKDGVPGPADEAIITGDDTTQSYPGNVIYDAPFSYFRMNEASGSAIDTMAPLVFGAYRNTPLLNQTASPAYTGQVSVRYNQTTVNEFMVQIDDAHLDFDGTKPMTFEVWFKWDGTSTGSTHTILGKGTQAPFLWFNGTTRKLVFSKADVADIFQTVNAVITANTWYHMVLTYQYNTTAALNINGASVPITTPTYHQFSANSNLFCWGSKSNGVSNQGEQHFRGWMSDAAIYNYILSPAFITRHYQQRIGVHTLIPGPALSTYQHFDPGTYWLAVLSYNPIFDPETYVALKIHRSTSDTVYSQGGWEPEGSPGLPDGRYREMTISEDGTQLCNDVMAWGFGMGSPNGVFKRLKSGDSIAEHGLWQDSATLYSVYKQATINKVADSIINGSPASKRGRKNDRVSVELVTDEQGLFVGDRVRFISHIWQFEDVIPVRKMEISFPTPRQPRFKLLLSHEIDRWGFQDPLPPFPLPGPYPIPGIPNIVIPPPVLPPTCVEGFYPVDQFLSSGSGNGPFNSTSSAPWQNWQFIPPPTTGIGNSSCQYSFASGLASMKVNNAELGVRLPWTPSSPLNKDTSTSIIPFRLRTLPSGATWEIGYGPVTVEFDPGANEVRVVTGSGTTTETWTHWVTSTSTPATLDPEYILTVYLNLEEDEVRVTLSHSGTGTVIDVTRAADGERVGVGDYQPEASYYWHNLTATDFTFMVSPIHVLVYADVTTPPTTDGLFDFTDPGWVEYTDDTVIGADPSVTYESDGTITLVDYTLAQDGSIRRDVNSGGVDLAFCISGYSTITDRSLLLVIAFGGSAPRECRVIFGNDPFVDAGTGTGSALSGPTVALFDGDPVNVRVQFDGGGMRVKQWAGGTAQPDAWDATVYFEKIPWPRLHLDLQMWGDFNTGNSLKLGPLQLDTGEQPEYLIPYPDEMGFPGALKNPSAPATHSSGRHRSWDFNDPSGTGAYAVPFGNDQYSTASNNVPSYSVGVVWPVFGPAPGNGVPYELNQELASKSLPAITHKGVPLEYVVRVRGTVTGVLGEALYGGVGATGVPGRMNVVIEEFSYGTGPAVPGGVPTPGYVDYNILTGTAKFNAIFDDVYVTAGGQHHQTYDFDILLEPFEASGTKYIQWGVYFYGIDDPTIDSIEQAGPLWGGGFLFTPNNCHYQAVIGNVTYEFVPTALGFPIQYNPDPCKPNPIGYDYGEPESGRICISFTGNGTGDEFDLPKFEAGSADVIVDGYTLTPGVDYTEDGDLLGVTIPTPPADGAWVLICVTVL